MQILPSLPLPSADFPLVPTHVRQAHGFIKVPFVLARHLGSPDLAEQLDLAVSALETAKLSLEVSRLAARVLESIVRRGWTTLEALHDLSESLDTHESQHVHIALQFAKLRSAAGGSRASLHKLEALATGKEGHAPAWAVKGHLGLSCHLPASFRVALGIASIFGGDYEGAVRANMLVGGDSCSRAILIGALCAASNHSLGNGEWALPLTFHAKGTYRDWSEELAAQNRALSS